MESYGSSVICDNFFFIFNGHALERHDGEQLSFEDSIQQKQCLMQSRNNLVIDTEMLLSNFETHHKSKVYANENYGCTFCRFTNVELNLCFESCTFLQITHLKHLLWSMTPVQLFFFQHKLNVHILFLSSMYYKQLITFFFQTFIFSFFNLCKSLISIVV